MVCNHRVLTGSDCLAIFCITSTVLDMLLSLFYLSLPKVRIIMSFAEIDDWNPMVDDFHSYRFNSYHDNMNQEYDPCCLYVKNVPTDLSEEAFISLMSEGNKKVKRFRILPVKPNSPVTCALVSYESELDATAIKGYLNKRSPFHFDIENAFKTDKASRDKSLNKSPKDMKMPGRGRGIPVVVSDTLQKLKVVFDGDKRTAYQECTIIDPNDTPGLVSIQCLNCKKQAGSSCARCKKPYCSLNCQRQDWPRHKSLCKSVSGALPKSTQFSYDSSYLSDGSSSDNDKRTNGDKMSGALYRNRVSTFHARESNYVKPQVSISPKNSPQQQERTRINNSDQKKLMKAAEITKTALSFNIKQKVTVCNICSPSSFWICLSDANKTLSQIEEELAKIQKVPVKSTTVDDICCVKKREKFCRAQILELQSNSSVLYFIDYGETSTVRNDEMYHLPHSFKKYPAQAVRCNLVDGAHPEVIEWTDDDISSFEFHAGNKTFVADVHGFFKNTYNISLINEDGISLHSILTLSRSASVDNHSESNGSIPSVLGSLKTGAEVAVAALQFEGDSKFFGLLDDGSGEVQVVIEELERILQTVQTKELNLTCEEGDLAAGFSLMYNQYYRCIVLKRLRNSFLVRYLDYGNQEEINKLCALTPDLLQKKSYVVCCERPSSIPADVFKNIFEKSCVVTVESVNNETVELSYKYENNTLIIHCYPWYHGTAIKNHSVRSRETVKVPQNIQFLRKRNSFPGKQCISKTDNAVKPIKKVMKDEIRDKKLSTNNKYNIKVAFIKNTTEMYIHFNSDENDLNALSQQINKHCSMESCAVYSPSVDEIVCSKFSEDGVWYRAQVIGRKGNKCKVHFIDYGNESIVCDSDIKPLPCSLVVPKFAACVSLHNIKNEDISDNLLKKLLEEVWTMEVKDLQKSPVEVIFFKGSKPLTEFLEKKRSNLKDLTKNLKSPTGKAVDVAKIHNEGKKLLGEKGSVQDVKSLNLPDNSTAKYPTMSALQNVSLQKGLNEVKFSFVEKNMYYCHLKNNSTDFAILTEKLLNPDLKPFSQKPIIGDLVCARSADKCWYRASIQSIIDNDSKYKVLFIDYGNCEYVSFDNVKCLPDDLLQYPIFCVPAIVTNIDRAINTVNINALLTVKTVGFSDKNVQLIEIVLPKSVNLPKLVSLKKQVLPLDTESEVSVCFMENDVFYTHMKSSKELILTLESKLINATQFNNITSLPEVGDLICAKFFDDIWYRGSVKKVCEDSSSCEIHFIDYGNSEIISLENMRVLPNSLCTFPVLSVPLKFRDIEKLRDEIAAGITVFHVKFLEMSSEQIPIVDIVVPKDDNDPSTTIDILTGKKYNTSLLRKTSDGVPDFKSYLISSLQQKSLPLNELRNVMFSCKENGKLYLQDTSYEAQLLEIQDDLMEQLSSEMISHNPTVDELLCTYNKLNDKWYRCCIVEIISPEKWKVRLIDFGNEEVVSRESLRPFTSKLAMYPIFAIPVRISGSDFMSSDIQVEHLYPVVAETLLENNVQLVKIVISTSSHTSISSEEISTNVNSSDSSCEREVSKYFFSSCEYVPFPPGEQDIVIYCANEECCLFCALYNKDAIAANLGLSIEITQYCESLKCSSYNSDILPEMDQLVLAKYSDDSQWYRAVILDNSSHPVYDVIFIDYGNSEKVHIDSMRRMEKQFMSLKVQANLCSLTGFDVDDEMLPSVVEELKNFTVFLNPTPLTALVSSVEGEISVNIPLITKHLMEKNLIASSQ
ncbi:tudor domain-containing protein 1 [Trichonephila clavata]|uniref:Tudor domain-containing protein 1 n=1 Tax=Trichonephila clavata TaxID=2740835 RepID=A0A8X6GQX1_TRICU|nr:tudor domain-containing protein 1 [Trichonephila clavata]